MTLMEEAWRNAVAGELNPLLVHYYFPTNLDLYDYPAPDGTKTTMPCYCEPQWTTAIQNGPPIMNLEPVQTPFETSPSQSRFLENFVQRKGWELIDGRLERDDYIFRLVDFKQKNARIELDFELARFSESIMCQYVLEQEAYFLLAKHKKPPRSAFQIRNAVAPDGAAIQRFFRDNVGRIGICNLILLRIDDHNYWPVVHKRSEKGLVPPGLMDPVSAGVFSVALDMYHDFEIKNAELREIYEELFGGQEFFAPPSDLDPGFYKYEDGIADLIEMIEDGRASFEFTGFAIDLIRIVPEITTVLVVRDPEYFHTHNPPTQNGRASFAVNEEFVPTTRFTIVGGQNK